jgi:hypothetical protein
MANRAHPTYGTVLAGVAVVSSGAMLFAPPPARVVGGLLLTLVLPGAAVTWAVFPRQGLSTVERLVLASAFSLATLALGGLGLHVAGVRLTQLSWTVLTAGVTVLAAIVGQLRQRPAPARTAGQPESVDQVEEVGQAGQPESVDRAEEPDGSDQAGQPEPELDPAGAGSGTPYARVAGRRRRVTFRRAALRLAPLVLTAVLLAAAGWFSLQGAARQSTEPFSALQMVPAFASEAPGPTRTVSVGLDCHERADTDYLLRVRGPAGFTRTLRARLRPGEGWARQVSVPSTGRVTVDLYRDGETSAYRTVFLDNPK